MADYTENEIQRGIGAFDQTMRNQTGVPGYATRFTPGVAIGIVSAAMRSGLKVKHMRTLIEREFPFDQHRLLRALNMYEGADWEMSLWNEQDDGSYKLCTALCRREQSNWRYDPSALPDD